MFAYGKAFGVTRVWKEMRRKYLWMLSVRGLVLMKVFL